jgi:hypothetical protein
MKADSCSAYHKLQDAKDVGWIVIPAKKHNYIEERKRR